MLFSLIGFSKDVRASFLSDLFAPLASIVDTSSSGSSSSNSTTLKAAVNIDPNPQKGGGDISIAGGVALVSESGPAGTTADVEDATSSTQISIYVVRPGDSLAEISKMFGVSKNTILWANNLKGVSDIHPGDTLVILPVSGVQHTVTKGETLASIVKKYRGDMQDVLDFNGFALGAKVAVGDVVIIPDGVDGPASVPASSGNGKSGGSNSSSKVGSYERLIPGSGGPALAGYFIRPIDSKWRKTQGLHGHNGVDFGAPVGTPITASADGTVIVARPSGYNGGYGAYIVINHPNGTQTVYGHLSRVSVSQSEQVNQGDVIGYSGNSGRSTGAHLHFEIRGAANPF